MRERQKAVLLAIIEEYVKNPVPVGSRLLAKNYFNFSSATIRNEMKDLEEEGYLKQLHTSSGRIPTLKAWKFYVENLLRESFLIAERIEELSEFLDKGRFFMEILEDWLLNTLNLPVMWLVSNSSRIKNIYLSSFSNEKLIIITEFDDGEYRKFYLNLDDFITKRQLKQLNFMLSKLLLTNNISEALIRVKELEWNYRKLATKILENIENLEFNLKISGLDKLFEFNLKNEQLLNLLKILTTTREKLLKVMLKSEKDLSIFFGDETGLGNDIVVIRQILTGKEQVALIAPVNVDYKNILTKLRQLKNTIRSRGILG